MLYYLRELMIIDKWCGWNMLNMRSFFVLFSIGSDWLEMVDQWVENYYVKQ